MDADSTFQTLQIAIPFRNPDWRWRRAHDLVASGQPLFGHQEDGVTLAIARYFRGK